DLVVHPLDGLLFPLLRARRPVERHGGSQRVVRALYGRRALGTELAQGVWSVRMPFDVDDAVAIGIHELIAADGASGTAARVNLDFLYPERGGRALDALETQRRPADG